MGSGMLLIPSSIALHNHVKPGVALAVQHPRSETRNVDVRATLAVHRTRNVTSNVNVRATDAERIQFLLRLSSEIIKDLGPMNQTNMKTIAVMEKGNQGPLANEVNKFPRYEHQQLKFESSNNAQTRHQTHMMDK